MRLKLLLLISFSFCSWVLWGQSSGFSFENIGTNKVIAPSPTAASLGKYGNIPIGLYTGAPDIKVPLYDINLSDIKVPVFLNYSGGGVKVGELASWVGLGWSLNAGGAITRVTRGLPDEMRLYSSNPSINLNPTNDQAADYITNIKDGQVDVFYFNFLGRAGRFVLDEEKKAFICPDQKMVIEPTKYEMVSFPTFNGQLVELMRYVITEWKIVDENGNQYYFSAYEPTRSYSRFTSNGNDGNFSSIVYSGDMNLWQATVNAWYISKIITSNGNQVQFSYNDKELIYDMPAEERRYLVQNAVPVNYTGQIKDGKITGQRLYINSKQLSEISFPGGRVSFTPSTISRGDLIGDNALQSVTVFNNTSAITKKYVLKYGYFQGNWVTDAEVFNASNGSNFYTYPSQLPSTFGVRLLLLNVQQVSSTDGSVIDQHKFEYFTDKGLPTRASNNCADHWGYANKAYSTSSSLLPEFVKRQCDFTIYGKEPDPDFTKQGSIKKITYPTGGSTEFNYELHTSNSPYLPKPIRQKPGVGMTINYLNFNNLPYSYEMGYPKAYAEAGIRKLHYIDFAIDDDCGGLFSLQCNVQNFPENPGVFGYYIVNMATNDVVWYMNTDFFLQLNYNSTTHVFNGTANLPYLPNGNYRLYHTPPSGTPQISYSLDILPWYEVYSAPQRTVGGLRVKETLDFDPVSNKKLKKTFKYVTNEDSVTTDGEVLSIPLYQYDYSERASYNVPGMGTSYATIQYKILSSGLSYPLSSTQGAFVGYPKVIEEQVDETTSQPLGKSVYTYSSPNTYPDIYARNIYSNISANAFPFAPADNFDWLRGQLLEKKDYSYKDNAYQLIRKTTNNYLNILRPNRITSVLYDYSLKDLETLRSSFDQIIGKVYDFTYGLPQLFESTTTEYANGNALATTTKYSYNADNLLPSEISTTASGNKITVMRKKYAVDYKNITQQDAISGGINNLVQKHMINPEIETTLLKGTDINNLKVYSSVLKSYHASIPLPDKIFQLNSISGLADFTTSSVVNGAVSVDSRYQEKVRFNAYDAKGNLLEQQKANDVKEVYLWGYNSQYPVAKIINTSYDVANTYVTQSVLDGATGNGDDVTLRTHLDNLRNIPGAVVSTYTYSPLVGVTSEADANNRLTYYQYDGFGRLSIVRDHDKNIIKKLCYNYAGQVENCLDPVYSNIIKTGIFTRNNCTAGATGSSVTYTVPEGTYNSTISQADADAKAQNDVNTNGQNYANVSGTCTWYSVVKSGTFTRNNCGAGGTGSNITYTVPAGTYNSTISQADADVKAQNDVNTNGQNYANANGTCTWYNVVKNGTFTRNNCAAGGTGSNVTYTVAAGTYSSNISQADADAKAQNDINTNGQNYANANGTCTWYSAVKSGTFTRNNCPVGQQGTSITYTVLSGTYNSTISQADADAKAQNDVNTNGQNYANTNGSCVSPVNVTLKNAFFGSFPGSIKIEFMQGGIVKNTYNFASTSTGSVAVTVLPGTYQLRFTMPTGTESYPGGPTYSVSPTSQSWQRTGSTLVTVTGDVQFNSGTTYTITAGGGN